MSKPEVVGYFMSFKQTDGLFRVLFDQFTTREDDHRKESFGDECQLWPVVWLTAHEAARAADKARIDELENKLRDVYKTMRRAGWDRDGLVDSIYMTLSGMSSKKQENK